MAAGWPTKANYATGDVLSATNMNDLSGTVNYLDPTSATDGQILTRDAASAGKVKWATASSSGSTNVAGKNAVLNSNFSIFQRGTTTTLTSTSFVADRWQAIRSVAGATASRQTTSDTTNLAFIQYCLRVQRDLANTSTSVIALGQNFESINSIPFAGKAISYSFYARAGANYSAASGALAVYLTSGTGTDQNNVTGSFTGATQVVNSTATLTTTWQRFTYTGTVAATATQLSPQFQFTPVGTALANDYYEITGVQVEIASSASAYSPNAATFQGELAACQRYYYQMSSGSGDYMGLGTYYSGSNMNTVFYLPVSMRTAPTLVQTTGTGYYTFDSNSGNDAFNSFTIQTVTKSQQNIVGAYNNTEMSGTAGYSGRLATNNASASVAFNAEL